MKSCHFDNMNESRGYFAEQNKPDRGRQILHALSYMWNRKNKKTESRIIETEQMSGLRKCGVWGK